VLSPISQRAIKVITQMGSVLGCEPCEKCMGADKVAERSHAQVLGLKYLNSFVFGDKGTKLPLTTDVIKIKLKSVTNLKQRCDPYVVMSLDSKNVDALSLTGDQKQFSSYHPDTAKADWDPDEIFQFVISSKQDTSLILQLYTFKNVEEDILVGEVKIQLKDVTKRGIQEIILRDPDSNQPGVGKVTLEYELMNLSQAASTDLQAVWEYERRSIISGEWGKSFNPGDLGEYSSYDGTTWKNNDEGANSFFDQVAAPWSVKEDWRVEATRGDPDGCQYALDFAALTGWFPENNGSTYPVRRRLMVRTLTRTLPGAGKK